MAAMFDLWILWIAAIFLPSLAPQAQPAPAAPSGFASLAAPVKRLLRDRATHCYLLPDGRIVDVAQYDELVAAIDRNYSILRPGTQVGTGANKRRLKECRWQVTYSFESIAWGFISDRALQDESRPMRSDEPRSAWGNYGVVDLDRKARPVVAIVEDGGPKEFIFIDETRHDRVVASMTFPHYTTVVHSFPDRIVEVELRALGQTLRLSTDPLLVRMPEGCVAPLDFLADRYLLVPDPEIARPAGAVTDRRVGASRLSVYEYVPLTRQATAEQLFDAILAGRFRPVVWSWHKESEGCSWSSRPLL